MVGGGGMGGPNKGSSALVKKGAVAEEENENEATALIARTLAMQSRERMRAANTAARATGRREIYMVGLSGVVTALGGAAMAIVGAIMQPAGAPAAAAEPMGSALVVGDMGVGFPMEAAPAAAAEGAGMGGLRMGLIGTGLAAVLGGVTMAIAGFRGGIRASERETRVAAEGGSEANAYVEAAQAAADAHASAAASASRAQMVGALAEAAGRTGAAAVGAGGTLPSLLNIGREGVRGLAGMGVAGIEAGGEMGAAGIGAYRNLRRAGIEAGASVRRAEIAANAAVNAAAATLPPVHNTLMLVGNEYAGAIAGMPGLRGPAGAVASMLEGAAAAAAGGGGARRRAGSPPPPLALPAPTGPRPGVLAIKED